MNRFHLTEVLETTLKQALAQRNSCGFMLVAIDNLARINESYGFDVADEAIGAVAKRLRAKMRGGDQLGRFSGNKFGIILNTCTPDDMERAAERLVAGVRDDVVRTGAGPVAVTVTVGGVTAPRHASNVQEILARARKPSIAPKPSGRARIRSIARTSNARRCGAITCAPPTRS
jgi:diguanylate cyclase (GGDEF)-like protein